MSDRRALLALTLLPGALVVFLGFDAGGYFPATPAIAAIVLSQLVLVRVMQARRPLEGMTLASALALGALAVYAALTLASALWSHSTGRALIEFDRAWLYLVTLLLFASLPAGPDALRRLVQGLALGAFVVCVVGLVSRVAPDVLHTSANVANERLSYPVTYWNALGLLAAMGILFAAHLTCSLHERRIVRTLAGASIPLLGATLFFTFSRGAIAVGAIGLALYVLLGRPRALLSGALATIPATAVLIAVAYHADLLDTVDPTTPAAVAQGHRVAWVALACALAGGGLRLALAARLDPRLELSAGAPRLGRRARLLALGALVLALLAAVPALGVPARVAHDWTRFASGAQPRGEHGDLRRRLTDPSNNQRTVLWRAALDGFSDSPWHGHGAGTFQTTWERHRPRYIYSVNAHSLYLQAMSELGLAGLVSLVALVALVLGSLALRARGTHRCVYAVALAGALVWALHAGVDWDWEMPVVTVPFFALAGVGLGRLGARARGWEPRQDVRLVLGVLCLATLALPVLVIGSQHRLDEARRALYASHCAPATRAALSSIDWLGVRAQPYEVLGLCDVRRGLPRLGLEALHEAARRDPPGWEVYYELALARAAAGIDPRQDIELALRLNPHEPLVRAQARQLTPSARAQWPRRAQALLSEALASNDLSLEPA